MLGILSWSYSCLTSIGLRELVIAYESKIYNDWNHTSHISCQVYNLSALVISMFGKSKVQPKAPDYFHPFTKKVSQGLKIDEKNFDTLRSVFALSLK